MADGDWFGGVVAVVCPRCAQQATVAAWENHLRLVCCGCSHTAYIAERPLYWTFATALAALRPLFESGGGLVLWFTTTCRGRTLWALDRAHLGYMYRFVASTNRTKDFPSNPGARQLSDKFPSWVVSAKNRESVLDAVARMRDSM